MNKELTVTGDAEQVNEGTRGKANEAGLCRGFRDHQCPGLR